MMLSVSTFPDGKNSRRLFSRWWPVPGLAVGVSVFATTLSFNYIYVNSRQSVLLPTDVYHCHIGLSQFLPLFLASIFRFSEMKPSAYEYSSLKHGSMCAAVYSPVRLLCCFILDVSLLSLSHRAGLFAPFIAIDPV
ncbi:hypothetical protein KCP76_20095 [Salmonella enterica subsp. enterica serovar Weltevreden]|nr:hypothetical protein KCP76_20095 [Salmonella enterica subsp. enterica serovar Weltevreden]